jgi:hypothetical protein
MRRDPLAALAMAMACVLVVPLVAAQTSQPARADAAISGVVVDAASGRPIPDAVVQNFGRRLRPLACA